MLVKVSPQAPLNEDFIFGGAPFRRLFFFMLLLHEGEEAFKVMGLFRQRLVHVQTKPVTIGQFLHIALPPVIAHPVGFRILYNGHLMLHADQVTQAADSEGAVPEVSEFPCAIQAGGVPVNVIMDVVLIRVGTYNEGMVAFEEPLGKFIANTVGFLRRNLTGAEGLTHLIGNHIAFLVTPGQIEILPFGEGKFSIRRIRGAGVRSDEFTVLRFRRVLAQSSRSDRHWRMVLPLFRCMGIMRIVAIDTS